MKQKAMKKVLPLLLIALVGCATCKVAGLWHVDSIVADGNDREWPGNPQYIDADRKLAIRVTNDGTAIRLCIASGKAGLKRTLRMNGLDIWFDPQGGEKHVFGIHLPGEFMKPRRPASHESPVPDRRDAMGWPPGDELPAPEPPEEVAVSYADATGPLTMKIAEVQRTGIDIGVGQSEDGRLVYELTVAFKAAPSLCELKPEMVVGVGILSGAAGQGGPKGMPAAGSMMTVGFDGGFGGPPPGGGMGGVPGGRGFHKRNKPLEVWLKVQLARPFAR